MRRFTGGRKVLPEFDQSIRCRIHPTTTPISGYGTVGQLKGRYTFCGVCDKLLSQSQDREPDIYRRASHE